MGFVDGESVDKQSMWHTYLCRARRLTRCSVDTVRDSESPIEVKPPETDDALICCQNCGLDTFYESISSIIFSVFTAEFRISLAARQMGIYDKQLTQYINKDGKSIPHGPGMEGRFNELGHYEKWRNFPSASNLDPTREYLDSIEKLKDWIKRRNQIAHAYYWRFGQTDITPRHALDCYESVLDSIFELNILRYKDRESIEQSKRKVSLKP